MLTFYQIPGPLIKLAEKIGADFEDTTINSCLINRYIGSSSFLPEHSDDEKSIRPQSKIYTISLGSPANVLFKDLVSGSETNQVADSHSLYAMSQESQFYWSHRINKFPSITDGDDNKYYVRYSITFRSIDAKYANSTILLGDSNTKYHYFEGDADCNPGSNKAIFGNRMPGKRIPTYQIHQIDPSKCLGFRNIILHVGLNDFNPKCKGRIDSNPNVDNVDAIFNNFVEKVESIQVLCPYAKLIVSPILPTKLRIYNNRALRFNKLLMEYLASHPGIISPGFNDFVNEEGFLDNSFGSFMNAKDPVHLGKLGINKLAEKFRECVLGRFIDGRGYSSVTRGGAIYNYDRAFPMVVK